MRWNDLVGFALCLALAGGSLAAGAPKRSMRLEPWLVPPGFFEQKLVKASVVDPVIGPLACPVEAPVDTRAERPLARTEIERALREDPRRLGSASLGSPTRGRLFGAVELTPTEAITVEGGYHWGTELTVRSIERAVRQVRRCHAGTPKLHVGDLSREHGGWLRPHRSHQSGLDADIGYYYLSGPAWYQHATAENLDRRRTWALIRALVDGGGVDMIFIDRSVQELLRAYVQAEDPDGLKLFQPKNRPREGVIRHAWGHATHMHVRFTDPASVELGGKLAPILATRR